MRKENPQLYMENVCCPVCLTNSLSHFVLKKNKTKQKTLTCHVFVSLNYCVIVVTFLKKITAMVSPPDRHFSELSPLETASLL